MNKNLPYRILTILLIWFALPSPFSKGTGEKLFAQVQERIIRPTIDYARTPAQYYIGGITVDGVKSYDDYVLIGLSGLSKGQRITLPGEEISKAIRRYWKHGLFSNASISVDSLVGDSAYLHIQLAVRPRISQINYNGVKKSEREDLETKLGLVKEAQLTPNMLDRARIWGKKYFEDKGFKNAEILFEQHDDPSDQGRVILDVNVDKKEKVKVNSITVEGNNALTMKQIKGSLIKTGAFKKTHEKGLMSSWFRSKKFIDEKWKEDKDRLITKYNEFGYRDARIVADSVVPHDEKSVDIYVQVEEGQKYFIQGIKK